MQVLPQANKTSRSGSAINNGSMLGQYLQHTGQEDQLTTFRMSTWLTCTPLQETAAAGQLISPTAMDTFPSRRSRTTSALSGFSTRVTAEQLGQSGQGEQPLFVALTRSAPHAFISAKEKHKHGNSHRPVTRPTAEQLCQPGQGL